MKLIKILNFLLFLKSINYSEVIQNIFQNIVINSIIRSEYNFKIVNKYSDKTIFLYNLLYLIH